MRHTIVSEDIPFSEIVPGDIWTPMVVKPRGDTPSGQLVAPDDWGVTLPSTGLVFLAAMSGEEMAVRMVAKGQKSLDRVTVIRVKEIS